MNSQQDIPADVDNEAAGPRKPQHRAAARRYFSPGRCPMGRLSSEI